MTRAGPAVAAGGGQVSEVPFIDALRALLADESAIDDRLSEEISVRRIPEDGSPVLYVVTLRGEAKAQLEPHLARLTGRTADSAVGVWVLEQAEVNNLLGAAE